MAIKKFKKITDVIVRRTQILEIYFKKCIFERWKNWIRQKIIKEFLLSKGYYNVEIVSSSAESKDNNTEIELTYSINAGDRYRIKKLSTDIDPVLDNSMFADLKDEFTS